MWITGRTDSGLGVHACSHVALASRRAWDLVEIQFGRPGHSHCLSVQGTVLWCFQYCCWSTQWWGRGSKQWPFGLRRWLILLLPSAALAAVLFWRSHLGIRLGSDELERGIRAAARLLCDHSLALWRPASLVWRFCHSRPFIPSVAWSQRAFWPFWSHCCRFSHGPGGRAERLPCPCSGFHVLCFARPPVAAVPQIGFYGNRYAYFLGRTGQWLR